MRQLTRRCRAVLGTSGKLTRTDLSNFIRGPTIATYRRRFKLRFRELNNLMEVGITCPELNRSDWIVVHSILGVLVWSRSLHPSESPQPGQRKNGTTRAHNNASGIHMAMIATPVAA
ncbi:hypothetical protein MLD38_005450 [Melastoma candidum]|uniref:Uncharacterized protein n=1 Tax=Melastoma candidum TaxID=119954 RepID=A0ACB9RND4_9MYRT|nr:hypothetical protein MLD38_005450 [Melastoma candidum]